MQKKAFVLLSGGIDSTTCLYKAIIDYKPDDISVHDAFHAPIRINWVEAISVNYGQKHLKEAQYAKTTCDRLGIDHTILDIGDILSGKTVMLTDDSVPIPNMSYDEIRGVSPTYVPFRNGTLLSAITAHAQKYVNDQIHKEACYIAGIGPDDTDFRPSQGDMDKATKAAKDLVGIYFGAHSEDAQNWAYPDCTPEFIGSMANAIYIGSYFCIRLYTPLQWLMKKDIITLGDSLDVDFSSTWSCYAGGDKHCGVCPTCRSRRQAFADAIVLDPTEYAA